MFVGGVLLSQQYRINLLNLCRCCPVISTVQHRSVKSFWCCPVISTVQYRSVKSLQVLSCYLNSTVYICQIFVGVVMLSQQYSIDLLNVCRYCHVISTVPYRSVKCWQALSCYLNSTVQICYMFVGVVLLSQQYRIDLSNVCRCCPVISTVQFIIC